MLVVTNGSERVFLRRMIDILDGRVSELGLVQSESRNILTDSIASRMDLPLLYTHDEVEDHHYSTANRAVLWLELVVLIMPTQDSIPVSICLHCICLPATAQCARAPPPRA